MPPEALAPVPEHQLVRIQEKMPDSLKTIPKFNQRVSDLLEEIRQDYHHSVKKAIGKKTCDRLVLCYCIVWYIVDYILKDPSEKERLHIKAVPAEFPHRSDLRKK